jgi:hypothetical protein
MRTLLVRIEVILIDLERPRYSSPGAAIVTRALRPRSEGRESILHKAGIESG